MAENKRNIGAQKEALALEYLQQQGVRILDTNFYFYGGELDIVAMDGEYLCFIEVKYRKNTSYGYPEEAVTPAKQRKIFQGARQYLHYKHYPEDTPCRFDVIAIYREEITWIRNAFF